MISSLLSNVDFGPNFILLIDPSPDINKSLNDITDICCSIFDAYKGDLDTATEIILLNSMYLNFVKPCDELSIGEKYGTRKSMAFFGVSEWLEAPVSYH